MYSLENVPLTVNFPGVDFIEESHHDERVEYDGEMLRSRRSDLGPSSVVDAEYIVSAEDQNENDDQLINGVADNILGHRSRDQRFRTTVRLPFQQFVGRHFRR